MPTTIAGPELDHLIKLISRLPGLGPRSARRVALFLLRRKESLLVPLSKALAQVAEHVKPCSICGNWDSQDPCTICTDETRNQSSICVVQDVGDVWAIERTRTHKGRYHVLGGVISPLDGVGPEDLNVASLAQRASAGDIAEVIIATSATLDGQVTATYIAERLESCGVEVTRLSFGLPVGGELDQIDDGTLSAALNSRAKF